MKSLTLDLWALASFCTLALSQASLPQVDLGYEIHQAIAFDEAAQAYNFSNIRYAQPPVGDLRFAAPVPPTGRNSVVQNGSFSPICPQAGPAWYLVASQFSASWVNGTAESFDFTAAAAIAATEVAALGASSEVDPSTTEDCLFLDVVVPKAIFDNGNNRHRRRTGAGAPVLVWIYGGGYTLGSKLNGGVYDPTGLIQASQANGGSGTIYVAMNYRLGAMGWLGGPTFQASGGVSNAALYDQRLALKWIKDNIHLFGGDPNQVTVIGESAGGGSIMHQMTAFGGQEEVYFQRAVPQSPGWLPVPSQYAQENTTEAFFAYLNVSTLAEARAASSQAVILANALAVGNSAYGSFTFGPTVDGLFVPTLPGLSLLNGGYDKDITVMAGHNTYEGVAFTPPYIRTNEQVIAWLGGNYPTISPSIAEYIVTELYPAPGTAGYSADLPYSTLLQRTVLMVTEMIFTCNTHYLARAYNNQTHNYQFEVPPSLHGFDVPYTFYAEGTSNSSTVFPPVADVLQGYITNFAMNGDPNGPGLPSFPVQGDNATQIGLNVTISAAGIAPAIELQVDPTANPRCTFWQKALYA